MGLWDEDRIEHGNRLYSRFWLPEEIEIDVVDESGTVRRLRVPFDTLQHYELIQQILPIRGPYLSWMYNIDSPKKSAFFLRLQIKENLTRKAARRGVFLETEVGEILVGTVNFFMIKERTADKPSEVEIGFWFDPKLDKETVIAILEEMIARCGDYDQVVHTCVDTDTYSHRLVWKKMRFEYDRDEDVAPMLLDTEDPDLSVERFVRVLNHGQTSIPTS